MEPILVGQRDKLKGRETKTGAVNLTAKTRATATGVVNKSNTCYKKRWHATDGSAREVDIRHSFLALMDDATAIY